MFDKNKMNFWRLAFVFAGISIITLFLLWSSPYQQKAEMMNSSMGNNMKTMHLENITIYDLVNNNMGLEQTNQMGSHHENQAQIIAKMSFLSTSIIFLLLPLIIGGAIILAIVWIK